MDNILNITNIKQIDDIIEKVKFNKNKHKNIVIFTNGNSWYIDTLIHNLIESKKIHEPDIKMIVFCSDKEGYKKCSELKFDYFEYVDIPDLEIDKCTSGTDSTTDKYTRLSFVKTVLISYIINKGYIPLYLDPDMAFIKDSIIDLLSYLDISDFICSGTKNWINTNIMLIKPTEYNKSLFTLTLDDVNNVICDTSKFGDEDFLRSKIDYNKLECVDQTKYPPGCDGVKYRNTANMIHSNCVSGLDNKIQLMKLCNAWFFYDKKIIMKDIWYPPTLTIFPCLLKGDLIEKRFFDYIKNNKIVLNRKYINVAWTNLYCNDSFKGVKYDSEKLQKELDILPKDDKYFTILQYAGNIKQKLPANTIVFAGSFGDYPLPLLYDNDEIFNNVCLKSWEEKDIFCSFVGNHTHDIRLKIKNYVDNMDDYFYKDTPSNNPDVSLFLNTTVNSKFCLAPRGFGRSSFRFYEIIKLGSIPIYVWDDEIWLPFQDVIDYDKLSVVIHIDNLNNLDDILKYITKEQYNNMISYANEKKHVLCSFDGVCEQIISKVNEKPKVNHLDKNLSLSTYMKSFVENFFKYKLMSTTNYLEFGGGETTLLASQYIKGAGHLITSNKNLYNKLSNDLSNNFNLNYIDLESTDNFGYPSSNCSKDKVMKYTNIINLVNLNFIDTILIKGRFRVACALNIFSNIKKSSIILFDDYKNRKHYYIIEKYYDIVDRIDEMVVLKKKMNTIVPSEIISQYILDPR